MNYENLKDAIVAVIKQNGNEEITGNILQQVLVAMVNSLGNGYQFKGIATPSTDPGTPDQRVFYIAYQPGAASYPNFGVTVSDALAVLYYDTEWHVANIFEFDDELSEASQNLVTSGVIYTALQNLADVYMQLVESAEENHLASFDGDGQVKDAGIGLDDLALPAGHYPDLFAGFAGNLVDTRSAGARQSFAFRQSGGDGVNYMRKILGRTEAWNNISDVASNSGVSTGERIGINNGAGVTRTYYASHKYLFSVRITTLAANDSVWLWGGNRFFTVGQVTNSLWTGIYSPTTDLTRQNDFLLVGNYDSDPAVTGTVSFDDLFVVDLTAMYGVGNEPTTADQFRALHPLGYYSPNAGELKNNAATGIKTRGFNAWDEQWETGSINTSTGANSPSSGTIRSKNYSPCVPNTDYCLYCSGGVGVFILWYDINKGYISNQYTGASGTAKVITSPANAAYFRVRGYDPNYGPTYKHDINVSISDASRNGTYEPYWERTLALGLNSIPCHDENNNAVVVNGLDGVGTVQDEAYGSNGYLTDIDKKQAYLKIDEDTDLSMFATDQAANGAIFLRISEPGKEDGALVSNRYVGTTAASISGQTDKSIRIPPTGTYQGLLCIKDTAAITSGITPAQARTLLTGLEIEYQLVTPKHLTIDNPFPAFVEVDNLGTEKRLPEDTADAPQAPFECDSNYSISTANLVRKLSQ